MPSPDAQPTSLPPVSLPQAVPFSAEPSGQPALTDMERLFEAAFERRASDIHLTEATPPVLRVDGSLEPAPFAPLSREDTKRLIYSLLSDRQKAQFERELELDLSIDVKGRGRFRVNVHLQRGSVEAAMRLVPSRIPTFGELGLPPVLAELALKLNGLVLITGPTGVGKTTTMAAMVDLINHQRRYHILTIEDPIEYVHQNHLSIIRQREVSSDTKAFATALIRVLRQDPDVIVIGEMRDLDTISTALTAAETGHLVLATLHTSDAAQTVDRILDVFPPARQEEVKIQLSDCLQAVMSQQLLPRCDRPGRVLAYELMVATPAVRHLIREHATEQIPTVLQTGAAHGMCTMDACLKALFERELITHETALAHMRHPGDFSLLGKSDGGRKRSWGGR